MDFIPIIISLAALLLSLLSYLRERRLITVDFDANCFALDVTKNIEAHDNVLKIQLINMQFLQPQSL